MPASAVVPNSQRRPVVVIKIGTSTILCDPGAVANAGGAGALALSTLGLVVDAVVALRRGGWDVVLVTSGGVGVGCAKLGAGSRPAGVAELAAVAAVGQAELMRVWDRLFGAAGFLAAQVLLTAGDVSSEVQFRATRQTLFTLLDLGVVPVVNENDTTAAPNPESRRFGDNDWLSALVATATHAPWLFLLTDVDQLYTADPRADATAAPIAAVRDLDGLQARLAVRRACSGKAGAAAPNSGGHNGAREGCTRNSQLLAWPRRPACVSHSVMDDTLGACWTLSLELTHSKPIRRGQCSNHDIPPLVKDRTKWIATCLPPHAAIRVSHPAAARLRAGLALRARDVIACSADFTRHAPVSIRTADGAFELARGITACDSATLKRKQQRQTPSADNGKLEEPELEMEFIPPHNIALLVDADPDSSDVSDRSESDSDSTPGCDL